MSLSLVIAACSGGGGGSSGGSTGGGTPPPPPPPPPASQSPSPQQASFFLSQATFGPTTEEIEDLSVGTFSLWYRDQLTRSPTLHLDSLIASGIENDFTAFRGASDSYWAGIIDGEDQLRQRMAYALSQILVVSEGQNSVLAGRPLTTAHYMDILIRNAFGNYRDLLEEVTYSPAMAAYLTYLYNVRENMEDGRVPDENYARELMQLFTIGLVELRMDGSVVTDNEGRPVETYDNTDVTGLAKVFTGLGLRGPNYWPSQDDESIYYTPLEIFPAYHSSSEKTFLGTTIPENTGAEASIDSALDTLFNHPNLAPFLSRQLIQRFTTSHPSPGYIQRVASVFESGTYRFDDGETVGTGQRGDLAATLAAVLMDDEVRQDPASSPNTYGKVREPLIRFVHWARAFHITGSEAWREDYLWDTSSNGTLGQHAFRAPSVFNFYRPGYIAPGSATGEAGLTAPELQIVNEASIIGFTNFISAFITDSTWGDDRTDTLGFHPVYDDEMAMAGDIDALIDRLDLTFTNGTLSDETRTRMTGILETVSIDDADPGPGQRGRVQTAVLLILTSPDYIVLR